ncbi:MAG TPA: LytTR family DNA-binding domain-containing protein [Phenylobacterium sp.]|uniref:LytTR family DNA-binding domain-containing protein n=1 Tax=Phenylobacterium sp. TaxID=1871053 RepID=UPI002F944EDF
MSGVFWRAVPLFAVTVLALNTVNMLTAIQDRPHEPWIVPAVEEYTSAVCAIGFMWIGWIAFRIAPPDSRPVWRMLLVQGLGLLAFAAAHVTGFYLLRALIFGWLRIPFEFDLPARFVYEARKDAIGYFIGVAAFWGMARLYGPQAAAAPEPAAGPAMFDIRDGARVLRVPLVDILAIASAGNYAEFTLADGRKPLMRSSLTALDAQLAPLGFVRTHRSWLVNSGRVTELRPERSGDYTVVLGGVEAPLSRRFPQALARIRGA